MSLEVQLRLILHLLKIKKVNTDTKLYRSCFAWAKKSTFLLEERIVIDLETLKHVYLLIL